MYFKIIKSFLCMLGNITPPPFNKYFFLISGVKFKNIKSVWIGFGTYLDHMNTDLIFIDEEVCISLKCTILTHYDSSVSISNPKIKPYKKGVKIGKRTFIGANSLIMPGVELGDNCFVNSFSLVTKSFDNDSFIAGHPAKLVKKI